MSDESNETTSYGATTVRNAAWLGGSQALRQGVAIATTAVLARFLVPADYGIFTMTMFVTELAQMLINFGMGAALIQRKEINQILLSTCFWINAGVGVVVGIALVIAGPWIAAYFQQPLLRWLMVASALNLLVAALAVLPQALLSRQLKFQSVAIGSLVGSVSGALSAVGLALAGFGVWALVLQPLIGTTVNTLYLFVKTRWKPSLAYEFDQVRDLLAFSGQLLGSNVIGHISKNLQSVILGPTIGVAALGLITMAQTVTWLPVAQISQTAVSATFPVFARMQGDWERLRPALYRVSGTVALFAFPLLAGVSVLSLELMVVAFGAQWSAAAPLLRVMSIMAMMYCATTLAGTLLMAAGRADRLLQLDLVGLPVTAAILWTIREGSVLQVVIAFSGTRAALQTLALLIALYTVKGRWRDYLRPMWRPLIGSAIMSALLLAAQAWASDYSNLARLLGLSALGAVIYTAWSFACNRTMTMELIGLIRSLGRRR